MATTRDDLIKILAPLLEERISMEARKEYRVYMMRILLEGMEEGELQLLHLGLSLVGMAEADEELRKKKERVKVSGILTPNLEEEVMPSGVRDHLIVGWCDAGRVISPISGCTLYRCIEEPEMIDNPDLRIRNYQLETPDGEVRHFTEYYSFKTSSFDNGWIDEK